MALQRALVIPGTGIVVPEAYFKVEDIWLHAGGQIASIHLSVYKDAVTRAAVDGKPLPEAFAGTVNFTASGANYDLFFADALFQSLKTNPRRQAYRFLKTQQFFAEALDV